MYQSLQTIFAGVLVYTFFKLFQWFRIYRKRQKLFANLPGPKEKTFVLGSFCTLDPNDVEDVLWKLTEWGNKYSSEKGYIRIYNLLSIPIILACHPFSMRKILKTSEPKTMNLVSGYRMMKVWLGEGLLLAKGEKWARNRRLLTPAFHFDSLKPYQFVFNTSAEKCVSNLRKFANKKKEFESFEVISKCTLDIILRCAVSFDEDVQADTGEIHPYLKAVRDFVLLHENRTLSPLKVFDSIFYLTADGKKCEDAIKYMHSVSEDVINRRKIALKSNEPITERKYRDFLDILLAAKDENGIGLSDTEIRNEVDTFLFAGHDTTASAISWILYSLAENPDHQQKCQEEIDTILARREDKDIRWSDLPHLEYLTMCIKEGMRLHCPVPFAGRTITKEMDLGGDKIPRGTEIVIAIWMIHHNEILWGVDHMEFKPERFTKENIAKMDPFQFVPFAGGPRNCIGQNFAMNEEKVVLAKLLYNFRFKLVPGHIVKKKKTVTMRAATGIMMQVEKRETSISNI